MLPHVVWFDDVGKDDLALAGGKGANLGELIRAGIPVPPGFVVTVPCYREYLERAGLRQHISAALTGVDLRDRSALEQASGLIKRRLETAPMPEEFAQEIRQAYARLGDRPVAVRSSATAEDLPDASFAGQQSTFLNVSGAERVIEAVRACWASLYEPQAIFYRTERGYPHEGAGIAVPVQTMLRSDCSGVMFTVNPVTSDRRQVVIEAVWGLGEAAVSGMVTPDMYVVDKQSFHELERSVAHQDKEIVRDPEARGLHATAWRDVPAERRGEAKLSQAQVSELARLGARVEAHYGQPQDLEWAVEGGALFVLQARPVTTL